MTGRPVESALAAAEAIRALNHATFPRAGGLVFPADAYDVLSALAVLAARLPQALDQLAGFLDTQCEHERIRVVDGEHRGDPVAAVTACAVHLEHAGAAAHRLQEALDAAAAAVCWAAASDD